MKAEDIFRIWNVAQHQADHAERIKTFARACEQHGIERAKASVVEAEVTTHPRYRLTVERSIDWSALDAEIAKENEGD